MSSFVFFFVLSSLRFPKYNEPYCYLNIEFDVRLSSKSKLKHTDPTCPLQSILGGEGSTNSKYCLYDKGACSHVCLPPYATLLQSTQTLSGN